MTRSHFVRVWLTIGISAVLGLACSKKEEGPVQPQKTGQAQKEQPKKEQSRKQSVGEESSASESKAGKPTPREASSAEGTQRKSDDANREKAESPKPTRPVVLEHPDPMVVQRDQELFTVGIRGEEVSLGKAPEDREHLSIYGHHLMKILDNELMDVELATGKTRVAHKPVFYGAYSALAELGEGYTVEMPGFRVAVDEPKNAEEDEYGQLHYVTPDEFPVPVARASKTVEGVAARKLCKWTDVQPEGRSLVVVEDEGSKFQLYVEDKDGKRNTGHTLPFQSPDELDKSAEQEGFGIESVSRRCNWLLDHPIMYCHVSLQISELAPEVVVWVNEGSGDVSVTRDLSGLSYGWTRRSPSGCWMYVDGKIFGVREFNLECEWIGWVPEALKNDDASGGAEPAKRTRPSVLAEVDWSETGTSFSSSDKPVRSAAKTVRYSADAIADGQFSTAWAEGKKGSGIDEWVELSVDEPVPIWGVRIWNGYQKIRNDKFSNRFDINERVEAALIEWGDGKKKVVILEDRAGFQDIPLDGTVADRVRINIRGVYKADYPDTCISEAAILTTPEHVADKTRGYAYTFGKEKPEDFAYRVALAVAEHGPPGAYAFSRYDVPVTWYDCDIALKGGEWSRAECSEFKTLKEEKDYEALWNEYQEEHDVSSYITGKVRRCSKGVCELRRVNETSDAEARVHTIEIRQETSDVDGRDIWVLESVRLVTNR